MSRCEARQYSDQMMCRCGRQWDVNDPEPPACPGPAPRRQQVVVIGGGRMGLDLQAKLARVLLAPRGGK